MEVNEHKPPLASASRASSNAKGRRLVDQELARIGSPVDRTSDGTRVAANTVVDLEDMRIRR